MTHDAPLPPSPWLGEVLEALPGPGILVDAYSTVVSRNRAAAAVHIGQDAADALEPFGVAAAADRATALAGLAAVLAGRQRAFTLECAPSDARQVLRVTPLTAASGGSGAVIALTSLPVATAAAAAIESANAPFDALFAAAVEPMVLTDRDGAILAGNPAAQTLLACDATAILRLHFASFLAAGSGSTSPGVAWQALQQNGAWRGAGSLLLRDGMRDLEVAATANVMPDRHLVCFRDVTDELQKRAQLRQAQKMESVGLLAGGMAHDFNNLLTVVLANADLVLESLPPEHTDLRDEVNQMIQAAKRGSEMVRKLLAFSRRDTIERRAISLEAVLSETRALLVRLLPANIIIQHEVSSDLPGVLADTGAVQHMLINLATNARDAMATGGVLTMRGALDPLVVRPDGTMGPMVTVTVEDTGRGMDAEVLEHLFEPFFTTKRPGEGTGLGMSMVHALVHQLDGTVRVQSTVGVGTTVTIALPPADLTHRFVTPLASPRIRDGATETILLVEDEDMVRRAGRRILEKHGYRVLLAADGAEALMVLRERGDEIALVVSDVLMPRMGGRELYAALRDAGYRMPFLFTTGYTDRMTTDSVALDPSVPVLPKPWTWTELAASVRAAIDAGAAAG